MTRPVARLQHRLRRRILVVRCDQPFRTRDIQRALHDNGQQVSPSDRIRQPGRRLLVQLAPHILLTSDSGGGAGLLLVRWVGVAVVLGADVLVLELIILDPLAFVRGGDDGEAAFCRLPGRGWG